MSEESRKGKVRYCARCQNHGVSEELKGHKRHCPYRTCRCSNCEFTQLRQSVMVKVGHLGRHRGDVTRALATSKRPRDTGHEDDVTRDNPKDGVSQSDADGFVERTGNYCANGASNNTNSSDDSSTGTPHSDSSNGIVDVTSSPVERLQINAESPCNVSDNQGTMNGAFVPTSCFGANTAPVSHVPVPVAAPPPKSEREGLSTISSIILGFCGNDAKKAVQCIEKAYKELVAIANPELNHTSQAAPPTGLHLARPPDVSSTQLTLSGHGSSHLPLGLGSMMTLSAPDPALMWTNSASSLTGSLISQSPTSPLFVRAPLVAGMTDYRHSGLFASESVSARLLKNPFLGSPALL